MKNSAGQEIPCDVVEGCKNETVDCVGGEIWHCAEHGGTQASDAYFAWQASPERAARVNERRRST